jgi:putative ABC transport system substrate-binding protein
MRHLAIPGVILGLVLGVLSGGRAQPARVGLLGAAEPRFDEIAGRLRLGLQDHGHAPGSAEILEARVARGDRAAARAAVEALGRQRIQVLFAIGSELARLARQVSAELPIVFITPGDPVAGGLVASLAHPGGNMTGMTFEYPELAGKRLELLKEIVPSVRRVLVLYDPRDVSPRQGVAATREAAPKLGLALVEREVQSREDVTRGLEALQAADAFLVVPGGLTSGHYDEIIRAANAAKRPTVFHARTRTTTDALASYGASDVEVARQAARLVDRILRGAKAGELPVERPTRLELVINQKTAKALGVAVPQTILLRADRVIQ